MKSVGIFLIILGMVMSVFSFGVRQLERDCRKKWDVAECQVSLSVTPVIQAENFRDVVKELKGLESK